MEDEDLKPKSQVEGPTMLVATKMLKPPPAVLSMRILPRTIAWMNLIFIIIFAFIGFVVAVTIFGPGMEAIIYGGMFGGALGFIIPQLSPLEGESVFKWIGLKARDAVATRVSIDGTRAKMYIGTYPLRRTALGRLRLRPSGLEVKAYEYDERGYPQFSGDKSSLGELSRQKKLRQEHRKKLKASVSLSSDPKGRQALNATRQNLQSRGMPAAPKARRKEQLQAGVSLSSTSLKKQKRRRH